MEGERRKPPWRDSETKACESQAMGSHPRVMSIREARSFLGVQVRLLWGGWIRSREAGTGRELRVPEGSFYRMLLLDNLQRGTVTVEWLVQLRASSVC